MALTYKQIVTREHAVATADALRSAVGNVDQSAVIVGANTDVVEDEQIRTLVREARAMLHQASQLAEDARDRALAS